MASLMSVTEQLAMVREKIADQAFVLQQKNAEIEFVRERLAKATLSQADGLVRQQEAENENVRLRQAVDELRDLLHDRPEIVQTYLVQELREYRAENKDLLKKLQDANAQIKELEQKLERTERQTIEKISFACEFFNNCRREAKRTKCFLTDKKFVDDSESEYETDNEGADQTETEGSVASSSSDTSAVTSVVPNLGINCHGDAPPVQASTSKSPSKKKLKKKQKKDEEVYTEVPLGPESYRSPIEHPNAPKCFVPPVFSIPPNPHSILYTPDQNMQCIVKLLEQKYMGTQKKD